MAYSPAPGINLVVGANGSGKTSLVEALFLAGRGHSFRTRKTGSLVQADAREGEIFLQGTSDGYDFRLGVGVSGSGLAFRLDGQDVRRRSILPRALPLQLITPRSHELFEAGPDQRRRFLDWGLFHVEHRYPEWYASYHRLLKQRNAALRSGERYLRNWDEGLAELGGLITDARRDYVARLAEAFRYKARLAGCKTPVNGIQIDLRVGWKAGDTLLEALVGKESVDRERGFTSVGPHRGELVFHLARVPATEVLSRGQQKIAVSILQLAQMQLALDAGIKPTLLIDDLPAELDPDNRERLFQLLRAAPVQSFVTGIDAGDFSSLSDSCPVEVFHVEHP